MVDATNEALAFSDVACVAVGALVQLLLVLLLARRPNEV